MKESVIVFIYFIFLTFLMVCYGLNTADLYTKNRNFFFILITVKSFMLFIMLITVCTLLLYQLKTKYNFEFKIQKNAIMLFLFTELLSQTFYIIFTISKIDDKDNLDFKIQPFSFSSIRPTI
jgi:hypothetical protein